MAKGRRKFETDGYRGRPMGTPVLGEMERRIAGAVGRFLRGIEEKIMDPPMGRILERVPGTPENRSRGRRKTRRS
ncbi:hypothetical protein A3K55_02175 [Candidatus Shapirobacteria bacterium RBG_13_44_7]|uniref:Uncharacterized protein n=1 Tax=Candidatus Shapirobacteria bacterium RBG_13_44_7 TaxID=1802149 RepID=A0A1F7SGN6_9BACT|nr:MAG: hypothetical protein A3K55_02175 [Candidatus Shapirobacteria bacterium RBG_13_44_7]